MFIGMWLVEINILFYSILFREMKHSEIGAECAMIAKGWRETRRHRCNSLRNKIF